MYDLLSKRKSSIPQKGATTIMIVPSDIFGNCADPKEAWEGKSARQMLFDEWRDLLSSHHWRNFITLSFKNAISAERAEKCLRQIVLGLNRDLLGNRFKEKVGSSYFSFAYVFERQGRGVLHCHLLVDSPVNNSLIMEIIHGWNGWADIQVVRNQIAVVKYICKGLLWGGDMGVPWFAMTQFVPGVLPAWWNK